MLQQARQNSSAGAIAALFRNGGKPNADTWEIFAEGYIQSGEIHKAMEAMPKSMSVGQNTLQPKPGNVVAILKHFEKQGDVKSAEEFFKILKRVEICEHRNLQLFDSYLCACW